MNSSLHSSYESFRSYENFEKILQVCGYQGYTDHVFMLSAKDVKSHPELLSKINNILTNSKLETLEDIIPYLRNKLSEYGILVPKIFPI